MGDLDEESKSYVDYEFEVAVTEKELEDLMARGHTEVNVLNEKYIILLKCLEAQEKSLNNYVPGSMGKEKAVKNTRNKKKK